MTGIDEEKGTSVDKRVNRQVEIGRGKGRDGGIREAGREWMEEGRERERG